MGDLTEVPVPARFLFLMMGPEDTTVNYHEVGRCMATLMSDAVSGCHNSHLHTLKHMLSEFTFHARSFGVLALFF